MSATKRTIQKELNSQSIFKSNNDSFTKSHSKPGGISTILVGSMRSKKNSFWNDSSTLIQRTRILTDGLKLSTINIYMYRPNTCTATAYVQALNTIRLLQGWKNATNIEDYFYKTLRICIENDTKKCYQTVIGGDFNDQHSGGRKMTMALGLLPLINITSPPGEDTPNTYKRGRNTLYHIWISSSLDPVVTY